VIGFEQKIDRVRHAGDLGPEHRIEGFRRDRHEQRDRLIGAHAERAKQVRRLDDASLESAVGHVAGRLVGKPLGERAKRDPVRMAVRNGREQFMDGAGRLALDEGNAFQRLDVRQRGDRHGGFLPFVLVRERYPGFPDTYSA
jgi:hypothetical protein